MTESSGEDTEEGRAEVDESPDGSDGTPASAPDTLGRRRRPRGPRLGVHSQLSGKSMRESLGEEPWPRWRRGERLKIPGGAHPGNSRTRGEGTDGNGYGP